MILCLLAINAQYHSWTTWVGQLRRGRRQQPLFRISVWNCLQHTADGLPRTNNSIEGFHRGFSSAISCHHPTIWKFIDALKREQNLNEVKIEQYLAGVQPPQPRRRYRDLSARLLRVVEDYGNRGTMDYLRSIAHNIDFQI